MSTWLISKHKKKAIERRHTTINATHCVRSSIVVSAIVLVISCRSVLLTMMRHMACVGCILIVVRVRRSRVGLMHRSSRRDEKKNLDSGLSERENFTEEQWEPSFNKMEPSAS